MKEIRIVFMGTPQFAVGILEKILEKKYSVTAVITAPDKPAGRGQKTKYSAVKEYALLNDIKVLQPSNLKDEDFLRELKLLNANLQIVVAFRMLPKAVWTMPELGTFNLHASLLPDYRGAAPINWAIINGDTKTGVTTFFIDDKIDTGAIILSSATEINPFEKAGELHDRLIHLGCATVLDTLALIENDKVTTTMQEDNLSYKTAPKLTKENCKINWTRSAGEIYNLIRGLSPYPAAWCVFYDKNEEWNVKIYDSKITIETHTFEIGSVFSSKKEIKIAVRDGFISILSLQFPGKKKMTAAEFLNGLQFSNAARVN